MKKKPIFTERAKRIIREHMLKDSTFGICKRCDAPFTPDWNDNLDTFKSFCAVCGIRNLADGFSDIEGGKEFFLGLLGEKKP